MSIDEKKYEVVGDIKIAKPKKRKNKKKTDSTPIGVKIFVWFMFLAMLASFAAPLIYYFVSYAIGS